MHTSTGIITYIIHIYISIWPHKRGGREKCVHKYMFKNMCMVPRETNKQKKGSTKAIQNAWMQESNNKTAANHVTACKLAVILHAHSKREKKKKAH